MIRFIASLFLIASVVTFDVAAQGSSTTTRIRGDVVALEGQDLKVKSAGGAAQTVRLLPGFRVDAWGRADLSAVAQGAFVGTTATPQADGTLVASEVHVFPESMRGTGEGHYDWDLKPNTKMTNANVEQTVAGVDGPVLSVKYKDGEKKLMVTKDTAVVTYVIGDKSDLKPGTKIFVGAGKKQADGTVQTPRVTYGKDGLTPPM
jgi:hypothetical protein